MVVFTSKQMSHEVMFKKTTEIYVFLLSFAQVKKIVLYLSK